MIEVTDRPIWIGAAVGPYSPIVFQRGNGFEPGHMCQLDGSLWVSEVPYRCATLADATGFAKVSTQSRLNPCLMKDYM
jgi:hypothetical protein